MKLDHRARRIATLLTAAIGFSLASAPAVRAQAEFQWPEKAKNLKVLPKNISKDDLRASMRGFAIALGVRCTHCHVGTEGKPLGEMDFVSDKNPNKNVARGMLRMLRDVNKDLGKIQFTESNRVRMSCNTCHHGRPRPLTLADELMATYEKGGIDSTMAAYKGLRARFYGRAAYDFGEESLMQLGSGVMDKGHADDAIALYRLNVEQYPESARAYDGLAGACLSAGKKDQAIEYYRKSLELDPRNRNAEQKLKELTAETK